MLECVLSLDVHIKCTQFFLFNWFMRFQWFPQRLKMRISAYNLSCLSPNAFVFQLDFVCTQRLLVMVSTMVEMLFQCAVNRQHTKAKYLTIAVSNRERFANFRRIYLRHRDPCASIGYARADFQKCIPLDYMRLNCLQLYMLTVNGGVLQPNISLEKCILSRHRCIQSLRDTCIECDFFFAVCLYVY